MANALTAPTRWFNPRGWLPALLRALYPVTDKPAEFVAGSDFAADVSAPHGFDPRAAMSAMGTFSWVVACASIRSEDLARLPLRASLDGRGRSAKKLDTHPMLDLLRRPYPGIPGGWARRQRVIDYDLTGTAYDLVLWDKRRPAGLMRMHPARTEIVSAPDGTPKAFLYDGAGSVRAFDPQAVVYYRAASWEDDPRMLYGQGKIRALYKDLLTDDALAANTTTSASKGRPDGIVFPDLENEQWTAKQTKEFREDLNKLMRAENGGLVVLGRKLGYQALGWSEAELATIDQRKFHRQAIQAVFGVPPVRLGMTEQVNFATSDQQMQLYWGDTMRALAEVHDEMWTEFARRTWPELGPVEIWHDFSDVPALQGMEKARLERVKLHVDIGMEPNAAYDYEGLTDHPEIAAPPPVAAPVADEEPAAPPTPEKSLRSAPWSVADILRGEAAEVTDLRQIGMGPDDDLSDRAAVWERYRERIHAPAERRMLVQAETYLDAYRSQIGERLDAYLELNPQSRSAKFKGSPAMRRDLIEILMAALFSAGIANLGWSLFESVIREFIRAAFSRNVAAWASALTIDPTRVNRVVDSQIGDLITRVDDSIRRDVRVVIASGLDRGESIGTIAAEIMAVDSHAFGMARAMTIARTETTRSIEAGNLAAYDALANDGAALDLEWLSSRDLEVRPEHVALDGQLVAVGTPFTVPVGFATTGATAMCPGDFGIASLDINCRCTACARRRRAR